jgi:hypothetical protein
MPVLVVRMTRAAVSTRRAKMAKTRRAAKARESAAPTPKTFTEQGAQGDLYFRRIAEIPPSARKEKPCGDRHIVAHSETGHHHFVGVAGVDYFVEPGNPLIAYLRCELGTTLTHDRPFDTHQPISMPPGNYELRRQREYVPGGDRRVED